MCAPVGFRIKIQMITFKTGKVEENDNDISVCSCRDSFEWGEKAWVPQLAGKSVRGQRMAPGTRRRLDPAGGDLHVAYRHWIVAHSSRLLPIAHLPLLTLKYIQNISCTATSTHCMLKNVLWHGLSVWACSTYRKEKLLTRN